MNRGLYQGWAVINRVFHTDGSISMVSTTDSHGYAFVYLNDSQLTVNPCGSYLAVKVSGDNNSLTRFCIASMDVDNE
jgi:hypothetical protein